RLEGTRPLQPTHQGHHGTGAPRRQRRDRHAAHRLATAKPFDLCLQLLHSAQAATDGLTHVTCVLNVHARQGGVPGQQASRAPCWCRPPAGLSATSDAASLGGSSAGASQRLAQITSKT
ncbi:MAG: hypothetical protein ACK56I_26115, partial [bacterium]